jgi:hypothetical protein
MRCFAILVGMETILNRKQIRQALKDANTALLHVEIKETDYDEFRVNFVADREATAYYTSDLEDAIGTAKLMEAETRKGRR